MKQHAKQPEASCFVGQLDKGWPGLTSGKARRGDCTVLGFAADLGALLRRILTQNPVTNHRVVPYEQCTQGNADGGIREMEDGCVPHIGHRQPHQPNADSITCCNAVSNGPVRVAASMRDAIGNDANARRLLVGDRRRRAKSPARVPGWSPRAAKGGRPHRFRSAELQ